MNKRMLISTSVLLAALLVSGCGLQVVTGSGRLAVETRPVGSFTSVILAGIGDLYLTQGENELVQIEAEDNLVPYFDTSVQGSTLKIAIKDQFSGIQIRPTRPVKFHVTLPSLEGFTLSGSGNILAGPLQANDFKISLLGSGKITADALTATNLDINLAGSGGISLGKLSASQVTVDVAGAGNLAIAALAAGKITSRVTGSGDITLSGKVAEQSVQILGSGDYQASGLNSKNASLRVTGSGNSQVWVSGGLSVSMLGSGDVVYSGNPKTDLNISGSGKVSQASP